MTGSAVSDDGNVVAFESSATNLDPLAELVKINPKSIGVGQYQHDVNQTLLRRSLQREVESCVNSVGVDANMASSALLAARGRDRPQAGRADGRTSRRVRSV